MKHFFLGQRGVVAAVAFIVIIGAFLRMYHLSDWLHFELDQARDAKVIISAVEEGLGNLPLLGPRAGGTFLRLGPGFYYLEYIGALVFGNTPEGLAVPIALFSIASIAVFYALIRRYFETMLSLGLAMLFSVSAFFVLYGRFVWNPNLLPFFLLFGFYSLLRSVDTNDRSRGRWFLVSVFSLAFATHLHFLAFVSLPIIVVAFLLIKRVRFSVKVWMTALGIVLALYVPMILNEAVTGGANSKEFLQAVQGKSNKSQHTLSEQVVRNITNQAFGYWVILSGYEESAMGQFTSQGAVDFELTCGDDCHNHLASGLSALAVFVAGGILLVWRFREEKDTKKKDLLLLSILWFGVCFILFTPLSYDFAPRFFLLIPLFPFLFVGLILDTLQRYFKKNPLVITMTTALLLVLIASNIWFVMHRLNELKRAPSENFETLPDRILKEKTRVTLEQQELVLDYMQRFQKENGYPIYMFSEPEHRRALKYLMERRRMRNDVLGFSSGIYTQGNYFLIIRSESNHTNRLKKYMPAYDVIEQKEIGTLTVFRLQPKSEAITADAQVFETEVKKSTSAPGVPERYTWSEWWNHQGGTVDDEAIDESLSSDDSGL